jgi:hypothetical protein
MPARAAALVVGMEEEESRDVGALVLLGDEDVPVCEGGSCAL